MRLPYGRRLACYWTSAWRLCHLRLAGARFMRFGPLVLVIYASRVSWSDLDRKVEASYRKRGAK